LQELFYKYLEERGVDTSMACFVADFVEFKEANEYMQWLKDTQRFISA
jgi:complement component 1 Q subcomponent-binding protein